MLNLIFHAESITKTSIGLANLVSFLAWFTHDKDMRRWWMVFAPSVIYFIHIERVLEHLCILYWQYLSCSISFSILRVSQKTGSGWKIWSAFGKDHTWYDKVDLRWFKVAMGLSILSFLSDHAHRKPLSSYQLHYLVWSSSWLNITCSFLAWPIIDNEYNYLVRVSPPFIVAI